MRHTGAHRVRNIPSLVSPRRRNVRCGRGTRRSEAGPRTGSRSSCSTRNPEAASRLALLAWPDPGLCTVAHSAGCVIGEMATILGMRAFKYPSNSPRLRPKSNVSPIVAHACHCACCDAFRFGGELLAVSPADTVAFRPGSATLPVCISALVHFVIDKAIGPRLPSFRYLASRLPYSS